MVNKKYLLLDFEEICSNDPLAEEALSFDAGAIVKYCLNEPVADVGRFEFLNSNSPVFRNRIDVVDEMIRGNSITSVEDYYSFVQGQSSFVLEAIAKLENADKVSLDDIISHKSDLASEVIKEVSEHLSGSTKNKLPEGKFSKAEREEIVTAYRMNIVKVLKT